jgi:DNA-binding NarL/FixJ family response regulator
MKGDAELGADCVVHGSSLTRVVEGRSALAPQPSRPAAGLSLGLSRLLQAAIRTARVRLAVPPRPTLLPSPVMSALRVAIADDSALMREGVARVLEDAGFEVVAQAENAVDLMHAISTLKPNVAVIDIRMPPTHTDEGVRAARRIREAHPGVGVVVLSQHAEPEYAMELLAEGTDGVGYLLKDRIADIDDFADSVRRVAEGGSALDPSIVGLLVSRKRRSSPLEVLSPREREVLSLMAEGRSNQAIADALVVTPRAVEKHITNIFEKLGLGSAPEDHRRVLAVLTFLRAS